MDRIYKWTDRDRGVEHRIQRSFYPARFSVLPGRKQLSPLAVGQNIQLDCGPRGRDLKPPTKESLWMGLRKAWENITVVEASVALLQCCFEGWFMSHPHHCLGFNVAAVLLSTTSMKIALKLGGHLKTSS